MSEDKKIQPYVPDEKESITPAKDSVSIEVKNLVVSPQSSLAVALGDADSFKRMVEDTANVKAIIWNEHAIGLITRDRSTEIWFNPEINPAAQLFFERKGEERRWKENWNGEVVKVWDGDYEPVQFTKQNLLAFLKKYVDHLPKDVASAIKSMKLVETKTEDSIMLDEESDDEKTVSVEHHKTNIPRHFNMEMDMIPGFRADLQFDAKVVSQKDDYGHVTGKKCIEITCMNARETMRNLMLGICDQLPKSIPRYYGRMRMHRPKED